MGGTVDSQPAPAPSISQEDKGVPTEVGISWSLGVRESPLGVRNPQGGGWGGEPSLLWWENPPMISQDGPHS